MTKSTSFACIPVLFRSLLVVLLFFSLNHISLSQELTRITPIGATASSFHKNENIKINGQYRKYAKYLQDNSPKFVFDNDDKSMWVPVGNIKGEWIELEFPYPVLATHIKVLTGCHLTSYCFRTEKKVKKFEVENDKGEKQKLTIKAPSDYAGFELGFKKPSKTVRIKILSFDAPGSKNSNSTAGFAEIVVGHKVFDSEALDLALKSGELSNVRKATKAALKKVFNPHAVTIKGLNPLVLATEEDKREIAAYLWDSGFRFYNGDNEWLASINEKDQLMGHFQLVDDLRDDLAKMKSRLSNPDLDHQWKQLIADEKDLRDKYAILDKAETAPLIELIYSLRPKAAEASIKSQITALAGQSTQIGKALNDLGKIEANNRSKYKELSTQGRKRVGRLKKESTNGLLTASFAQVTKETKGLTNEKASMATVHDMRKKIVSRYSYFTDYPAYKALMAAFQKKKTSILEENASYYQDLISNSEQPKMLDRWKALYFSAVNDTPVTLQLKKSLEDKKEALLAASAAKKAAEEKAALLKKREKYIAVYNKLIDYSQREITVNEWKQVIKSLNNDNNSDLVYYTSNEMDINAVLTAYLLNQEKNKFYVHNQATGKSHFYVSGSMAKEKVAFKNDQDIASFWDPANSTIKMRSKPRITKIISASGWDLAKRCASVRNYLQNTGSTELKFSSIIVHKPTGIPVVFQTKLVGSGCAVRGAYDNCNLPCMERLQDGSDNYYFYLSDYMFKWNVK